MLDEGEWTEIVPFLQRGIEECGVSFSEVLKGAMEESALHKLQASKMSRDAPALQKFEEITGFKETNINAIYHHRRSLYGPECPDCGKPIRTPQARFCAECGYKTETQ
jgi:hypothetical protein